MAMTHMTRAKRYIPFIAGGLLVGLAISLQVVGLTDTDATVQLIMVGLLVIITTVYAVATGDIARSAHDQANAALAMADEMKQQRLQADRPVLVPSWRSGRKGTYYQKEVELILSNKGRGPALNTTVNACHPVHQFVSPTPAMTIEVGSERHFSMTVTAPDPDSESSAPGSDSDAIATVRFQDIEGNWWQVSVDLVWSDSQGMTLGPISGMEPASRQSPVSCDS